MTLQDEIILKKRTVEPGDYIPEMLKEHKGDMEWMETHKEEYLKAEEEFVRKITQVLDWHPSFARAWLTRAVWYKIINMAKIPTYPKWLKEDYPETEDSDENSNQMDFEGKTIVTTSGTRQDAD